MAFLFSSTAGSFSASSSAARFNVNSTYSTAVLLPLKNLGFYSLFSFRWELLGRPFQREFHLLHRGPSSAEEPRPLLVIFDRESNRETGVLSRLMWTNHWDPTRKAPSRMLMQNPS